MDETSRKFVIVVSVTVSSLIALLVISAVVLLPFYTNVETPATLENWGGLIIGFYFGSFIGLIKDWSAKKEGE